MAKPKVKVLVNVTKDPVLPIEVWVNDLHQATVDIVDIEGVRGVSYMFDSLPIRVMIDKRYDVKEIADEIYVLLTAEVPDIFKEK